MREHRSRREQFVMKTKLRSISDTTARTQIESKTSLKLIRRENKSFITKQIYKRLHHT